MVRVRKFISHTPSPLGLSPVLRFVSVGVPADYVFHGFYVTADDSTLIFNTGLFYFKLYGLGLLRYQWAAIQTRGGRSPCHKPSASWRSRPYHRPPVTEPPGAYIEPSNRDGN